ncbi:hypothetical protein HMI56_006039, partial [Coelomomyces lativittatus]
CVQGGNAQSNTPGSDIFIIPEALKLKENDDILTEVFGKLSETLEDVSQKAIICATNAGMMHINEQVLQRLLGETVEYFSIEGSVENEVTGLGVFP